MKSRETRRASGEAGKVCLGNSGSVQLAAVGIVSSNFEGKYPSAMSIPDHSKVYLDELY